MTELPRITPLPVILSDVEGSREDLLRDPSTRCGRLATSSARDDGLYGDRGSISAAVLAGGKSRRMGQPKALLRLEPDGPTFIEGVVSALRGLADDVFLVGCPDWSLPEVIAGLDMVEDARQGAADGLIAALGRARHDLCVVTACDMPFLDVTFLAEMVDVARDGERSVLARDETGRHPLHAVYWRADLPRIMDLVASGERSLAGICDDIDAIPMDVGEDEARRWSVFNINTPDDLTQGREHMAFLKEHSVDG